MTNVKPPSPPYLGPAAHTTPGSNKPFHRVVIHSTVSPCKPGGARDIAAYFRTQAAGGSAHYVVDPGEDVQVVYDNVIAWHAPPNANSLGIEMCDTPGPVPNDKPGTARWKAAKRAWRWILPNQRKMLARTAKLTARLCAAYGLPPVFLSSADLLAGKHGVTTHNNVSQAWHQSTHWDPGFWPRGSFMRQVRKEYKLLTHPQPAPATDLVVYGYNLATANGRRTTQAKAQAQVTAEVKAILGDAGILALCEAVGYDLPDEATHELIRDTSTPSRENIALYVPKAVGVKEFGWVDCKETWTRPDHPKLGQHPPRSVLWALLGNGERVVATQAPQIPNENTDTRAARAEFAKAVENLANRWKRPTLLVADWNGTTTRGKETSAATIAAAIGGQAVGGDHIDGGIVRGLAASAAEYVQKVGTVTLRSDHKHAVRFTIRKG